MMMNDYVALKIRDLENERLSRTLIAVRMEEASAGELRKVKPLVGPALFLAGRALRRVGEGLEGWAAPASEARPPLGARRRAG
jgi:hypothetical protein